MSWEQLLSTVRERREIAREEEQRREHPVDCPNDGTPLVETVGAKRDARSAVLETAGAHSASVYVSGGRAAARCESARAS
jgi:hypothetical protein